MHVIENLSKFLNEKKITVGRTAKSLGDMDEGITWKIIDVQNEKQNRESNSHFETTNAEKKITDVNIVEHEHSALSVTSQ